MLGSTHTVDVENDGAVVVGSTHTVVGFIVTVSGDRVLYRGVQGPYISNVEV
jgi:hypothetical protein